MSQNPGFAPGKGPSLKELVPLASGVWVSLVSVWVPVLLGVGENVVALTVILCVSELQCFWLSQISRKLSFLCDPVILGVPEHLGVGLPLSLIKVVAEPLPQICSAHWFRPEGTRVPGWAGDPASLVPRETSYSRC